ncbi:uncharacterized protein B0T15DRAFT_522184 [Chaetomium strumarium]|uniref:Uncharacterized protein n=1 Tax=Chaetomium strumarium TaxID=1170767 RepID=A0AAJ0M7D6_9PEZI|nr:hypothetical protein B0T15DRAFT_522184 [Chaetomium strumarium]
MTSDSVRRGKIPLLGASLEFVDTHNAGYLMAPQRGMSGPIILLFPLWIAKDMYANLQDDVASRKEGLCLEVFRELAARGMKIPDALASLSTKAP